MSNTANDAVAQGRDLGPPQFQTTGKDLAVLGVTAFLLVGAIYLVVTIWRGRGGWLEGIALALLTVVLSLGVGGLDWQQPSWFQIICAALTPVGLLVLWYRLLPPRRS